MSATRVPRPPTFRRALACLCCLVAALSGPAGVAEPTTQIPDAVRVARETGAKSLSPLSLRWTRTRTSPYELKELLERLGPGVGDNFLEPYPVNGFNFQDGKVYSNYVQKTVQPDGKVKEIEIETAWDGQFWSSGNKAKRTDPRLMIETLDNLRAKQPEMKLFPQDYFEEAGYYLFNKPATVTREPQCLILYLVANGAKPTAVREEKLDGLAVLTVELAGKEQTYRFVLDPARGYAVLRREERATSGALAVQVENSDFVKLSDPDLWLPRKSDATWYTWSALPDRYTAPFSTTPLVTVHLVVDDLRREKVDADRFVLEYKTPGAVVSSARIPGAEKAKRGMIAYRVPADPTDLDAAIQAAREKQTFAPPSHRGLIYVGLAAAGVLLAAGAFAWWRRAGSSRRPAVEK
jgi:hypothetical protein